MLSDKNRAVLLSLMSSSSNDKGNTRHKREKTLGDGNPNHWVHERIALVDAGRGWDSVKRECVLLKRKG
jgi:hypothetical protein